MKGKRRLLAMLVSLCACFCTSNVLTACGGDDSSGESSTQGYSSVESVSSEESISSAESVSSEESASLVESSSSEDSASSMESVSSEDSASSEESSSSEDDSSEGGEALDVVYQLGDVVQDFSITATTYDKESGTYKSVQYTLSEVLKEKELVVIYFWATWCGPCKSEFPYMHNAVMEYEDTVSVIALSTTDDKANVDSFQNQNAYTHFNMAPVGNSNLDTLFGVSGIPQTVMIDRYGVVVFNEVGSMPSVSAFTAVFDKYVGDDYIPSGSSMEDSTSVDGGLS